MKEMKVFCQILEFGFDEKKNQRKSHLEEIVTRRVFKEKIFVEI